MAAIGDPSNPVPTTLASLWLKPTPAQQTPSETTAPPSTAGQQQGLLFSVPPAPQVAPVRSKKRTRAKTLGLTDAPGSRTKARKSQPNPRPPDQLNSSVQLPERRIFTVRALVTGVRENLETAYADIWVEGEISNCRPAPSGHLYFTLKDGDAQLLVVLFRRQAQLLRFRPQDGLAILARGRVSVYESRGQLQLIAETIEPRGAGALQLAYEQLRDRLKAEGLFDAARKRQLPAFPRCIGVITSTGGAVLHDILTVIGRRHARLNLLIYPAFMQGPECAATVAAGIHFFNRNPALADVILIARGGGSLEDLAGFNDETLARTIAGSDLPVVSGIGHETDFTIADFVADLRAPTPSAAAELITGAQHRIEERIQFLDARVLRATRYQLILARQRLTALSIAHVQSRLQAALGRRQQRLDDLQHRLGSAAVVRVRTLAARLDAVSARLATHDPTLRLTLARRRLEGATQSLRRLGPVVVKTRAARLAHAAGRLEALSPLAVLSRGYAIVYSADGGLLRDAGETRTGQKIRARLAAGTLEAEVTSTRPQS